ncbi:MAG: HAMP domain-containing protein [Parachlamydiaceae bacterium]|nr:HAMP domain-containing protein [Parachlamydiaceae bacterium]
MTIRSKLLFLLMPTLTALVALIALFFYVNWSHEIINSFETRLQSVVVATAQSISSEEIEWITQNINTPELAKNPRYQQVRNKLVQLKQQLPIDNLYVIRIEPIKESDKISLKNASKHINKDNDTSDDDSGYKQVFLLDASNPQENLVYAPGEIDYSETEEHKIYFTRKPFVTQPYESRKTGERFLSAYAPIFNSNHEVVALLGADVSMAEIDQKLQHALLAIFLSTLFALTLVMATVFLIANRISKPVQQLNQAALDIAAGNYEANIQVDGPREIVELANTFNTMSECLVENISRLREGSIIRERMYGEFECALLLQYYMLQKTIEDFTNPHLQIRLTSVNFSNVQTGLLFKIEEQKDKLSMTLIEALDQGFEALFDLNKNSALPLEKLEDKPYIECQFQNDYTKLSYLTQKLNKPLVWSMKSQQFVVDSNQQFDLQNQDMVFLYNSGLIEQFETEEKITKWFSKVLRHFSEDGLDSIHVMLTNELNFLAKRENLRGNFQIISIQIKIPELT